MQILVLNPPSEKGFIRSGRWTRKSRASQNWYPIHLGYATGVLQQHGFNCGLLDASASNISYDQTYLYITKVLKPDVVLFFWCYDNMEDDLTFADLLAKYTQVILVGPWSLCAPEALSQTKRINIMTYGEFEHTILEILETNHYTDVKGVIWRNHINGEIIKNPPRPLCSSQELDEMPFVTSIYKQFLNIKLYRQTSLRYPFVDLFTARGCPNRCSFCVWPRAFQGGPSYRARSISNVIDEFKYIKTNLPEVKQVWFQDDTMPQKHALELSQAILDVKLKIVWGCYSRAELSYNTLKLMKESGCRTLHIGYESPIQINLDIIHKDLTVDQMKEFAGNVKKLNMWSSATFMIFPWQTPAEIKFTINWAKSICPKRMNFIQAQAYPNTPFADALKTMAEEHQPLMSFEEMKKWEQWGFKHFYVYNPKFWWEVIKNPRGWKQVTKDAWGLLQFLR